MKVEVKFFANFREILGQKKISVEADNVQGLLEMLWDDYEELRDDLFEDEESLELRNFVNVMVNGRRIEMLEGRDTELKDGDTVAIFPPVAGG